MSKLEKYSAYKDSGIEWLGEIPEGWEIKKIKHISRFDSGFPFNSQKFNEDGRVIVVRIGDIKDTIDLTKCMKSIENKIHKNTIINRYDTLIALSGATTGKSCFIKEDIEKAYINQRIAKFNYMNSFLYYCISNEKFKKDILLGAAGSAQENVSNSTIENMFIPFPNNTEQTKIASFLDTKIEQLDKAIKQKEQLIELLKERRQILINDAVTKGVDKTVAMKESGVEWIGDIPEHWEVKKLKYNLQLQNKKANIDKKLVIALENIEGFTGKYIKTNSKYEGEDNIFQKHDILFGKLRPYLSKVFLCKSEGVAFGDLLTYRPKNHFDSKFAFYLLISAQFIKTIDSSTYGSKMPRASSSFINEMSISTPPKEEQINIADYIEDNNQKTNKAIDLQQQQITKLKEYKITLIDSVVTGKVRVQ